jgi:hypothetical protein
MLRRENIGGPPVSSDFDPLHQAGLTAGGCNWQFAHERESSSVKEAYHVAKNAEEISARVAAASHGWGI